MSVISGLKLIISGSLAEPSLDILSGKPAVLRWTFWFLTALGQKF